MNLFAMNEETVTDSENCIRAVLAFISSENDINVGAVESTATAAACLANPFTIGVNELLFISRIKLELTNANVLLVLVPSSVLALIAFKSFSLSARLKLVPVLFGVGAPPLRITVLVAFAAFPTVNPLGVRVSTSTVSLNVTVMEAGSTENEKLVIIGATLSGVYVDTCWALSLIMESTAMLNTDRKAPAPTDKKVVFVDVARVLSALIAFKSLSVNCSTILAPFVLEVVPPVKGCLFTLEAMPCALCNVNEAGCNVVADTAALKERSSAPVAKLRSY